MAETREIRWETPSLQVVLNIEADQIVRLKGIQPAGSKESLENLQHDASLPLTEIRLEGSGTCEHKSSKTLVGASLTERLKYQSHQKSESEGKHLLEIISHDDVSKLTVTANLVSYPGTPALRSFTAVKNEGEADLILTQVTSLVVGGLAGGIQDWYHEYVASSATNTWFREAQWHDHALPTLGLDNLGLLELNQGHPASQASYSISNHGSFSTGGMLPMGMLKRKAGKETWLWQIEHNGSWRWELGDWKNDVYVAFTGPTDYNHNWRERLSPGETFTSVPVALVHVHGNIDDAFAALMNYRRQIRRVHTDNDTLPIIFNDYMNCLMGDPSEDKVKALVQPALSAGAEYFVIDAGWYAVGPDWWDSVGEWSPSPHRFPHGFNTLINHIRAAGLIPGCWLEPEVIGVRSKIADQLPAEACFQRGGVRVVEKRRYQLDYRHPAVISRMNTIIDNLVHDYGIAYFKFDYNIDVVAGTNVATYSSGSGALAHNRAYLAWVNSLFDRHPHLVIESCASGGQRLDYATLATHPLQSTSDQQDPVLYAAISAAIPTAVCPEQAASWTYPQPEYSDEINVFTVVNSLLGRVHLSGNIHRLSEKQLNLVSEGMDVYKSIRGDIKKSTPFWPLGLPGWRDEWMCLGLKTETGSYLAVWRRGGGKECRLPVSGVGRGVDGDRYVCVEVLYPREFEVEAEWDAGEGAVRVRLPDTVCARLLRISERKGE